ncbi:Galactose Mutarotase [Manis pentadactyla]|nr:Galactose Mutarotase [Manis pentadactyla]
MKSPFHKNCRHQEPLAGNSQIIMLIDSPDLYLHLSHLQNVHSQSIQDQLCLKDKRRKINKPKIQLIESLSTYTSNPGIQSVTGAYSSSLPKSNSQPIV